MEVLNYHTFWYNNSMAPHIKKSSFSLPAPEIQLVLELKSKLGLRSNTAVIREALKALKHKIDRESLQHQFESASQIVRQANAEEYKTLDKLNDEDDL